LHIPQRIDNHEALAGKISYSALQVKDITQTTNVYQTGTVADRTQPTGKLHGSVLVCTTRDTDKEVFPGFANITSVNSPRFLNRINNTEVVAHYCGNTLDLTTPAGITGTSEHSAARSQNSRIFNERRVRILFIRRQADKFDATRFERFAVCVMLSKSEFVVRFA
jgi:hypothetical protein